LKWNTKIGGDTRAEEIGQGGEEQVKRAGKSKDVFQFVVSDTSKK
jgi:hypothetical protein